MTRTSSLLDPQISHRMTYESPDTLCIHLNGPLMAAEAKVIITKIHELGREFGPMYWLIDVSQFSSSGERVRDIFLNGGQERYPILGGVMCGAPFPVRVAMMMVLTAGSRIMPKSFSFPFEFTATEEQARAWIAGKREADIVSQRRPAWAMSRN